MKLARNRQAGQVLILVLILMAVGPLLVVPMLQLSYSSQKYHSLIDSRTMESYAADAGAQYAMYRLYDDPYTEDFTVNFTLNDRTVTVTAEGMGNNIVNMTSTATSPSGRSTTIECNFRLPSIFQEYAVADTGGGTTIQNSYIDSSPVEDAADIHSNGDIYLESGSQVEGWATYLGNLTGEGSYLGETQVEVAEQYPPIDTEFWKAEAQEGGTRNGDLKLDDREDYTLGPLYITGDLEIRDCEEMDLNGVVYVEGQIKVLDESEIRGSGALISVQGDIEIKEESRLGRPNNLILVMCVNGEIKGQGGGDEDDTSLNALMYAPTAKVYLQNVRVHGSIVGKEIYMQNSYFTYKTDFVDPERLSGGEVNIISYGYGP